MKRFCLVILLTAVASSAALAQVRSDVGTLVCRLAPKASFITSAQRIPCVFISKTGNEERYEAILRRTGIDVGIRGNGQLTWIVYSASRGLEPRGLTGTYVGAGADVAIGLGASANALVGGSRRTIALQPVSVESEMGLALGVRAVTLRLK